MRRGRHTILKGGYMAKKSTANRAKRVAKKHPKIVIAIVIILVLIIAVVAVLYVLKPEIFNGLFDGGTDNGGGSGTSINEGALAEVATADFSIHFIELGNKYAGDGVLIKCGDTEVLIDAGSRADSAPALKAYIDTYCTDGILEYVISTHSDQDHIAAFVGNKSGDTRTGLLYQYQIGTFIKFDKSRSTTIVYSNYLAALEYISLVYGTKVYTASQCYDETDGAKRQYYLDEEQTLSINILYNYYYYNVSSDENNHSVVTLLTKELEDGNKYYLFTGDLEEDGESRLVDYYADVPSGYDTEYNVLPKVELYKAGHHGSKTSSTEKLLAVIQPKYVAVCCVAGSPEYTVDNNNTFPTQQMIDNVGKYTDKIYVTSLATDLPELGEDGKFVSQSGYGYTSMNGNIVFFFSDGELKLYCSNNTTVLRETEWFKSYRVWNGVIN